MFANDDKINKLIDGTKKLNNWQYKMNAQCLREIHGQINFYSLCIDCGYKKLETIDKKELSYLLWF